MTALVPSGPCHEEPRAGASPPEPDSCHVHQELLAADTMPSCCTSASCLKGGPSTAERPHRPAPEPCGVSEPRAGQRRGRREEEGCRVKGGARSREMGQSQEWCQGREGRRPSAQESQRSWEGCPTSPSFSQSDPEGRPRKRNHQLVDPSHVQRWRRASTTQRAAGHWHRVQRG